MQKHNVVIPLQVVLRSTRLKNGYDHTSTGRGEMQLPTTLADVTIGDSQPSRLS